jgi:hypothetical protein
MEVYLHLSFERGMKASAYTPITTKGETILLALVVLLYFQQDSREVEGR